VRYEAQQRSNAVGLPSHTLNPSAGLQKGKKVHIGSLYWTILATGWPAKSAGNWQAQSGAAALKQHPIVPPLPAKSRQ